VNGIPTGFTVLDAAIPGGGWPVGCLTELFAEREGAGELSLLAPALARLSAEDRWIAFVAPPYRPCAPALAGAGVRLERLLVIRPEGRAQCLWALRQCLASHAFGMVVGWLDADDMSALRRLQLAAEGGGAAVLFRPARLAAQASIAALKLRLEARHGRLAVHVVKRRGARLAEPIPIEVARPCHAVARPSSAQAAAAGISACHA
jgi:cell division inhibitor SulA/protein ImuA